MESTSTPFAFFLLQRILRFLLRLLLRLDVQGVEHLPYHGPAIITSNHTSWMDLPLIGAYCPSIVATFAADKWKGFPVLGWILGYYGQAIWVNRGAVDRKALFQALRHLEKGGVLGLAPEGTRSHSGVLQQAHDGIAWVAARSGALIVPVAMWGHENMTYHWLRLRRPLVHMHVGEPFLLPPEAHKAHSRDLEPYTEQIMRKIAIMLPPEQRGYYA